MVIIKSVLKNPYKIFSFLAAKGFLKKFSDEKFIKLMFRARIGYKLDLNNVQTFNEKLQWLKLYYRKSEQTTLVDKYSVKKYVANTIGDEFIIPTIGVWDKADDIDFDELPEKFVLKCTHNSGLGMCICHNKSDIDIISVKKEISKGLKQDYYLTSREWPYKNVDRRVIAEEYMEDESGGLIDYKVHCFNGEPRFILVCKDRFSSKGLTEDFYSVNWNKIPVKRPGISNSDEPIPCPEQLDEILRLSAKLAVDLPFVRVDFYIINNKVYFSELTFFPASGFELFEPFVWDKTFGDWLQLPSKSSF